MMSAKASRMACAAYENVSSDRKKSFGALTMASWMFMLSTNGAKVHACPERRRLYGPFAPLPPSAADPPLLARLRRRRLVFACLELLRLCRSGAIFHAEVAVLGVAWWPSGCRLGER